MNQIEREELVERYLAGEMSQPEESNFFLHVAVDDELQRTLKAFQIVDRTIQSDRDQAVSEHSPYRDHVMALLIATPAVISGGVATAVSHAASGAGSSIATGSVAGTSAAVAGGASWLAGFGLAKIVAALVLGGSLLVGTGVAVRSWMSADEQPARQQTTPAVQPAPAVPQAPVAPSETAGQPGEAVPAADAVAGAPNTDRAVTAPVRQGNGVAQRAQRRPATTVAPARHPDEPVKLGPQTNVNPSDAILNSGGKK